MISKGGIQAIRQIPPPRAIEATVRFAAELGYEATVVKDATADYSDEMMHAALEINMPNYASAVVTTDESLPRSPRSKADKEARTNMPKFATVGTIEVATGWEDHLLLLLRAKSGLTP